MQRLSKRLVPLFGVALNPVSWEDFAPLSAPDATNPQHDILRRIEPSSIFIGILYRRYGTEIPSLKLSGTEIEFNHAIENRRYIRILSYFRDQQREKLAPLTNQVIEQLDKVNKLIEKLEGFNINYRKYKTVDEFRNRILLDLLEATLPMVMAPAHKNVRQYAEFFRFSSSTVRERSRLLIVYPPISTPRISTRPGFMDWQRHLLPMIAFEDAKTIQKLETVLRLLGRDFQTVTTDSPELDQNSQGDKIWICIPRNGPACDVLERLADSVRFRYKSIQGDAGEPERILVWKTTDGNEIEIRSPLAQYLKHSKRPKRRTNWDPRFGYTYARDYGVLARFAVRGMPPADPEDVFYHYFLGGTRGLGTWGIGWYIDHCISELAKTAKDTEGDIQILVEVTYKNYHIAAVDNVSEKKPEFFEERGTKSYIEHEFTRATTLLDSAGRDQAEDKPSVTPTTTFRPFGLCAGEFTVPEEFDDPLPEDILNAFEGT